VNTLGLIVLKNR